MKTFYLFLLFAVIGRVNAQYTAIPDAFFEQELINQNIDSDGVVNGQVLTSDVNTLTTLELNSTTTWNILSLTGIESFTALETLYLWNTHSLMNLNLNNPQLQSLYLDFCDSLIFIDITNLSQLKLLYIADSVLPNTINVSNNLNLETIGIFFTLLTTLDVSNNINLKSLYLQNNNLSNLDVSNNSNLINLGVHSNGLVTLDVTNNFLLEKLGIYFCGIETVDFSQNLLLKELGVSNNYITAIDVSNNLLLEHLSCYDNNISSLNLNNNPLINNLDCSNNNLQSLQLQNGNNNLLNGTFTVGIYTYKRFNATNNPNLHCIFVDDVANCTANWLGLDATSHFVASQTECDALSNEEFTTNEISVYPNPVKDILYINNRNETIEEIVVYDLLAKKVIKQNNNNTQINLSNLIEGFYIIKIKTESGFQTQKIVKQ